MNSERCDGQPDEKEVPPLILGLFLVLELCLELLDGEGLLCLLHAGLPALGFYALLEVGATGGGERGCGGVGSLVRTQWGS